MNKYYKRLVWILSVLVTVIAITAMAILTKERAEDIQNSFFREVEQSGLEISAFGSHSYTHPAYEGYPYYPMDETEKKRWAIEAAYAAMWTNFSRTRGINQERETGYVSRLYIGGEQVKLPGNFLVICDAGFDSELYAPIPDEFWEMADTGNQYFRRSEFLRMPVRITGLRYQGMVYINKLEVYCDCYVDEAKGRHPEAAQTYTERIYEFDLSGFMQDVPEGAEPYRFESMYFGPEANVFAGDGEYSSWFAHMDYRSFLASESDFSQEEKMQEEAAELLVSRLKAAGAPILTDNYEFSMGLRTSYVLRRSAFDHGESFYVYAYVTHPLRRAMGVMVGTYVTVLFVLVVFVVTLLVLVQLLRDNQERYERSRLAMTRAVAHELKTPLAVAKSYAENWEDIPEESRETYRRDMLSQIDYVNGLVADLLELARMEAKAKEPSREPVNIAELNDVVLGQVSALTADREITVNKPEDTESLTVQADLKMMRTVLMNLVTNAVRYGEKTITIDISRKRDRVRYRITNDGTPIPPQQLEMIWDAFYMGDASRTGDGKSGLAKDGTGLGLAITKQILELHGAEYGCTSDDKGTTVWFELSCR
jgi:Signal transduction histidine kinase